MQTHVHIFERSQLDGLYVEGLLYLVQAKESSIFSPVQNHLPWTKLFMDIFDKTKFQGSFSVGQMSSVQFGQNQMSGNPNTGMYHLYVLFGKKKLNSYMHKLKKWLSVGDVRNREKLLKDDKISAIK